MSKIKAFFTENLLLKLLSLAFAVITWMLVVNINNPAQSRNFTTNVTVINAEVLKDQGKFYTIPEGANTVTFRVTAPRSIIERLSSDDFRAVADMKKLEDDSRIPIDISAPNYSNTVTISNRTYYLNVSVGDEMEKKFVINAEPTGEPANGFVVKDIEVDPNIITVRGPESIVSTISNVVVYCEVTGMNEHISENVVPVLLDEKGNRVDTTKLTLSQSTVNVAVSFTNIKEVPIILESEGSMNEAVEVTKISLSPARVKIMGDSLILNDITEITIPTSVVDLSNITDDVSTTVDISRYLPSGATLTVDTEPEVKININVSKEVTQSYNVPVENISVRGLRDGKEYVFVDNTIKVDVTGFPSIIKNLDPKDMTGTVSLEGLVDGEHTIRVEMDEQEDYSIVASAVKVEIKNKQSNTSTSNKTNTTNNTDTNNTGANENETVNDSEEESTTNGE